MEKESLNKFKNFPARFYHEFRIDKAFKADARKAIIEIQFPI